jgi:hypothetical protein
MSLVCSTKAHYPATLKQLNLRNMRLYIGN